MPVTEQEELDISAAVAKTVAKQWKRGYGRWREHLADAWLAVRRANRNGYAKATLKYAAVNGIKDGMRQDNPDPAKARSRSRGRGQVFLNLEHVLYHINPGGNPITIGDTIPAREDGPEPADRLQSLWYDTRHQRAGLSWRERVVLYLYSVECWSMSEIGRVLGFSEPRISQLLTNTRRKIITPEMNAD